MKEWDEIAPFAHVVVTWHDAETWATMQYDSPEEAIKAYVPALRKTIGYWLGHTEEVVVLGTDDDRSSERPKAVGGIHFIPHAMVKRVRVTSAKRKQRKKPDADPASA